MKKLMLLKEDGIDYVIGFERALINPMESRKKVQEEMPKLDEFKELKKAKIDYLNSLNDSEKKKEAEENIKNKQDKLNKALAKKESELVVYFPEKEGEKLVSKESFQEYKDLMKDAKRDGKIIDINKKFYINNKGKRYFLESDGKITEHIILKFNEDFPAGSIKKLSKEQRKKFNEDEEKDKISQMSESHKNLEYENRKSDVLKWANEKVIELEIGGMSESDAKSQVFTKAKKKIDKLKQLYNIA